jgi:DNA mismatch repair protein MutS2
MREIDSHSVAVLEFHKVRDIIAGLTLSPYGRIRVEHLRPQFNQAAIELALRQSAQMRDIIRFEEAIPLEQQDDISELIAKSRIEGLHLEPKELLKIKNFLETAGDLHAYGKAETRAERFPDVVDILLRFHPKREVATAIRRAIDPSGDILSAASTALGRIRRELVEAETKLKQHLEKVLSGRRKHAGWQDDVITIRDGRYVIPVLSGDFRPDGGIVHDKSQSGATLFIEPASAIPLNNRLRQLQQDERLEMDRILRELTAMVGEGANDIAADLDTYGLLDSVHAKAAFALKTNAAPPVISDAIELHLLDARHPLLVYAAGSGDNVVPLTISLDRENQAVLITGPNTGGKTVALKTIGLLTLMAMAGLEIPADHKSRVGIYRQVYADIGDEQSLELSLSTFSSHIHNIIAALNDADMNSLVLFDEIGAGTDPKEGAALAEVIILTLLDRGCNLIATTHYSQLKTLPLEHPELVNASLEFDRENLRPTFRLKIGLPGASYAIDIARRLGFPDAMAEQAAVLLGSDERSLDKLIARLDHDLEQLQTRKKELDDHLARIQAVEQKLDGRQEDLDRKEQVLHREFVTKLEQQLQNGKREIDQMVREIRESQAAKARVKETQEKLRHRSEQAQHLRQAISPPADFDGKTLQKGDHVWIEKFGAEGEVVEMIGDKRVKVAIGSAFVTVETMDLKRVDEAGADRKVHLPKRPVIKTPVSDEGFNPEILLRGLTVDEALEKLDKFLDDAVVAGVGQVYIVHGKGTGRLRKQLSIYLKAHAAVESIRIGDWNEGGHGVTIARLNT